MADEPKQIREPAFATVTAAADVARAPTYRRWSDDEDEADGARKAFKPLTREEAQALREREPPLNLWRVVAAQAGVGATAALLVALAGGAREVAWSVLYGAVCVALPGALMARGMTSRLSRLSPVASAVSVMLWEMVKIAASVTLLMLAPRIVQPLSWPALLAGLVLCMLVYWFALLWRGRKTRATKS